MATRRVRKPEPEPAGDLEFADDLDIVSVLQDELGSSDDVKIEVYQITADSGSTGAYAFSILPEQAVTLKDYTRDNWGAGKYRVVAKRLNGRYIKQWRFQVAAPLNAVRPSQLGANGTPPAAESETNQLLRAVLQKLNAPAAPAAPGATVTETLNAFKTYHELMTPKANDAPMQMFREGMTFAKEAIELAGRPVAPEPGSLWERLLEKLAPIVAPIIEKVAAAQSVQPSAEPQRSADSIPPALAPPIGNDPAAVINHLVEQAKIGADPEFSTQLVLERVPENILAAMETHDDPVAVLAQYFPQVAPYRAWFSALIDSLYETDQGDDADQHADIAAAHQDTNTGRPGRNAGSAQTDAGAGAPGAR